MINGFVGMFVGLVAIVPFGWALRTITRSTGGPRSETFADLGFWFLLIAAPVYAVSGALGAMLVQAATGDAAAFGILFRLYDVLYNGAADVLEGAWIGAFSIAALGGGLPRQLGWLCLILAGSRWIKAGIPFFGVPEAVATVSGVLFIAWFLWAVLAVTRIAMRTMQVTHPRPATA